MNLRIQTKACQAGTRTEIIHSGKTYEVTEHLGRQAVEKNIVVDKISEEFCKALPSGR
jgi:hypothetical protein